MMRYKLYEEVALLIDVPKKKLKKGDLATIVEYHPSQSRLDGYTLEVFNALGHSIAVLTVSENDISPLHDAEVLNVRSMKTELQ